ncbi:MAG: glycosyltransferase family 39 protein [Chloroflexi bacterium]|nr:glycosyltransferase family 39 protein [Chloroflexota bacterium]
MTSISGWFAAVRQRIIALAASCDVFLAVAVAVGVWLRFSRLGDFDNQYYTATAVSMLKSPSNFLFGSFDPKGIVMVDKPPVSFWVQSVSVTLFGPTRWAVSLPQAVVGTAAIIILYLALKPAFGRVAAVAAALTLAVRPASVMIDSRNEPDSLLSFTLLLASASVILAARDGRWRWLMVFAVLMGVAFNIKMLAAFVPLPAFLLYYLISKKQIFSRLFMRVALATALLLLISFSWTAIVAFTPTDQRPYVGSTRDNSIWTLVFKYNGVDRFASLIGLRPRQPIAQPPQGVRPGLPPSAQPLSPPGTTQPAGGIQPQPPPAGDAGATGLASLFTDRLAGQTGWLLPLALFMLMVILIPLLPEDVYRRPVRLLTLLRETPAASQTILWGGWLITAVVAFGLSVATTTHPYYLVALAVPLAAVAGTGFAILWRAYREQGLLAWLLPGALLGGVAYQTLAARHLVDSSAVALALGMMFLAALGMVVAIWRKVTESPLAGAFVVVGAMALLVVPTAVAIAAGGPIAGPAAGPARPAVPPPPRTSPEAERVRLVSSFIEQEDNSETRSVVATVSTREAAPFIIAGVPAIAIGGFSGNDPIFTTRSFLAIVEREQVRYFLMPGGSSPSGPGQKGPQEAVLNQIRSTWQDVSMSARLPPGTFFRFAGAATGR